MRAIVLIIGLAFAGGALVALATGRVPAAAGLAIWAAIVLTCLAVERWRYKRLGPAPPGIGWRATGERFVDPESGRPVTVYFNPATGERRYGADAPATSRAE
ncbi:MAG TPA: hypothetical protein VME41_10770 [Stellaceae bacterium]|nr:hypothetical protein [Stellaceae bacterium]